MYTDWKRLPEQLEEGVNPQEIVSGILLDRVCTVMQSRHGRINKWCGSLDYELENGATAWARLSGETSRRKFVYLWPMITYQATQHSGDSLGVSASTVTRIINGYSGISPEMALRLSKALGRSAESWLAMQHNYDLWQAKQTTDLSGVTQIDFAA
jgi:addiction module HigA family antidote